MSSFVDWNQEPLDVRFSRVSKVPYCLNWQRNVLGLGDGDEPHRFLQQQVSRYVAHRNWFTPPDAEALKTELGRISKFQSLRSEDALTWSWFGVLCLQPPSARRAVVQWLYDHLDLGITASEDVIITQWARVRHPNTGGSNGPEIDAILDDPAGALIYVEAKWIADLGTGQGAEPGLRDDQVVLRRDAMRRNLLDTDRRPWVVLGVSAIAASLDAYAEPGRSLRPVMIRWTTWNDLASCSVHPLTAQFAKYLPWKKLHA